jgi:hypothetical protein
MSKLKLVILTTMIAWSGFELSQTATAAQSLTPTIMTTTNPRSVVTNPRARSVSGREYFALAKGCTLKRYRRPR